MKFEMDILIQLLQTGLADLDLILDKSQQQQLIDYLHGMKKWNKAYNLTAINDPKAMLAQHLLDSLSIHPFLSGQQILDVGTGAGLPGIPLAIANPNKQFILLDSLGKRTRFLQQMIYELALNNVSIVNSRVEDYHPEIKIDQILTRAFASVSMTLQKTEHLQGKNTQILAMKGANYQEELEEISKNYTIVDIRNLVVPQLSAIRTLVIIEGYNFG